MLKPFQSPLESPVAAGSFGAWLSQARSALRGSGGIDVPCGDCTGCCTSGYSVQVRPTDERALAKIPGEFLISVPGFPNADKTLRPRPDGTCLMLHAGRCSIYSERPQTCLDYDCRIFAAAGIDAGGTDKAVINRRVRAWQFSYPTEAEKQAHEAVLAAAAFVKDKRASFPNPVPTAPMGIAVLAIKVYTVFLDPKIGTMHEVDIARAVIKALRTFDASEKQPGALTSGHGPSDLSH